MFDIFFTVRLQELIHGNNTTYIIFQPACFGAGCYIEMATSYHQPHEYELVGG